MRLISSLLRFFFQLLYHQFAWTYDFVAAVVSLGRWKGWVRSALTYLSGRVLEIGYGPGHLQLWLHERGLAAFGLDESRQMARQASRRLHGKGFYNSLACGYAQALPFPKNSFETVAATFPAEFIFEGQTLAEIRRVLVPGGRLVIVATAWITGKKVFERLAAWLFEVPGQAGAIEKVLPDMKGRIQASGFKVRHEVVKYSGSRVLVIVATSSG
jgi:ubiquinone/menaquinone biosynthesis C-methylase UbiE